MGFNNFRLNICLRVLLLASLLLAMLWSFSTTSLELTPFACAVLALFSMIELIYYVESSNRKLKLFLDFIHHHDFSNISAESGMGQSFSDLSGAYQLISQAFQRLNAEKQANASYLESVVEHINIALIGINANNEITLMNRQAKVLFQSPYLPSVGSLKKLDPGLPELIHNLRNNEHKLISLNINNDKLQLAVHAIHFQLIHQDYKLISFQNIRDELEQHEISSWQKLIKVLTHEIMNSVTPIISLSGVLKDKLINEDQGQPTPLNAEDLQDIQQSIRSIESRSKGLHHFVQTYRRLTTIPAPVTTMVTPASLLENVAALMSSELEKHDIELELSNTTGKISINVDPQQIEQVLINLIKNAIEALSTNPAATDPPLIKLHAENTHHHGVLLQVIDNGPGLEAEYLEQAFVPFFTTKEKGTGIGLSISRQIVIQNKGALTVVTTPGQGCTFQLRFHRN